MSEDLLQTETRTQEESVQPKPVCRVCSWGVTLGVCILFLSLGILCWKPSEAKGWGWHKKDNQESKTLAFLAQMAEKLHCECPAFSAALLVVLLRAVQCALSPHGWHHHQPKPEGTAQGTAICTKIHQGQTSPDSKLFTPNSSWGKLRKLYRMKAIQATDGSRCFHQESGFRVKEWETFFF